LKNIDDQIRLREGIRKLEIKMGLLNDSEMSCCKVTLAQCHAIVEIGRAGGISLAELAGLLNLDSSTMSRTVNNLVNSGYVIRELDPKDRRYVTIELTENGRTVFKEIESGMERKFSDILNRIPEDKRVQVLDCLELLTEAFESCC
jgi:DNA-binding MarR family transcriptional regulator